MLVGVLLFMFQAVDLLNKYSKVNTSAFAKAALRTRLECWKEYQCWTFTNQANGFFM